MGADLVEAPGAVDRAREPARSDELVCAGAAAPERAGGGEEVDERR